MIVNTEMIGFDVNALICKHHPEDNFYKSLGKRWFINRCLNSLVVYTYSGKSVI